MKMGLVYFQLLTLSFNLFQYSLDTYIHTYHMPRTSLTILDSVIMSCSLKYLAWIYKFERHYSSRSTSNVLMPSCSSSLLMNILRAIILTITIIIIIIIIISSCVPIHSKCVWLIDRGQAWLLLKLMAWFVVVHPSIHPSIHSFIRPFTRSLTQLLTKGLPSWLLSLCCLNQQFCLNPMRAATSGPEVRFTPIWW